MNIFDIILLKEDKDLELWDQLLLTSPHSTMFHQSWWLKKTKYNFSILAVLDRKKGRLIAGIPLPSYAKFGFRLIRNPPLTPYLGPVFDIENEKNISQKTTIMRKTGELLATSMAQFDSFHERIGTNCADMQGFLWAGFRVEGHYTYIFPSHLTSEDILAQMHSKHRRELTKAERKGMIVEKSQDIDSFLEINAMTYERQKTTASYGNDLVRSLWSVAKSRKQADLYMAKTENGAWTDGVLCFKDNKRAYLVLAAGNPEYRGSGGGNLVLWKAIEDVIGAGLMFDFEGSAIRGVEKYYRRWGAIPTLTYSLCKEGTWKGRFAIFLKNWK